MAEELDDGEFWLPSQFLTEEDILMDFEGLHKLSHKGSSSSLSTDSVSPVDYSFTGGGGSTEAESDEDDFLAGIISRSSLQDSGSVHNPKGLVLPSSPQSTLSPVGVRVGGGSSDGWGCGSSRGSPTGLASPPSTAAKGDFYRSNDAAALDLLNAAAGEVARMKLLQNQGTGYFDSSRGVLCPHRNHGNSHSSSVSPLPAPMKNKNSSNDNHQAARRPHFHGGAVFPQNNHLSRAQFQALQFQQLRNQQMMTQKSNKKGVVCAPSRPVSGQFQSADKSRVARHLMSDNGGEEFFNGSETCNISPLGSSPSAWQPLHRNQDRPAPLPPPGAGMRAVFLGQAGDKRECAGTGVFLPRWVSGRCGAPNESRKNSNKPACSTVLLPEKVVQALDNINRVQSQRLVRSQSQYGGGGTQAQRSSSDNGRSPANVEIQLPSEWTY